MSFNYSGDKRDGNEKPWLSAERGHKLIGYVESVNVSRAGRDYSEIRDAVEIGAAGTVVAQYPQSLVNGYLAPLKGEDVGSIVVIETSATKTRTDNKGKEWPVSRCFVISRHAADFSAAAADLARLSGKSAPADVGGDDDLPF